MEWCQCLCTRPVLASQPTGFGKLEALAYADARIKQLIASSYTQASCFCEVGLILILL